MDILASLIKWIYSWVGNYGWAIVIFTIMIRIVLFPFDYKSRVSMRKTQKLQPKMAELQKKYAKDKDKLNRKMSELYKQEHVSPLSGCLPLLLTYPILIWMFNSMRAIANEQVVQQVLMTLQNPGLSLNEYGQGGTPELFQGWIWVKNLWMADSPASIPLVDLNAMRVVGADVWSRTFTPEVIASLPAELGLTPESFTNENLQATVSNLYTWMQGNVKIYMEPSNTQAALSIPFLFTNINFMKLPNGYFLLPALSAISQFVMTKLQPTQPAQPQVDANGKPVPNTGKFMTWFFPIFSLWICASSNAVFALYWVTSNLIAMAQTVALNKYLDRKEARQADVLSVEGKVK